MDQGQVDRGDKTKRDTHCRGVGRVILLLWARRLPSNNVWSILAVRGGTLGLPLTFLHVEEDGNKDQDWESQNLVRKEGYDDSKTRAHQR